MKLTTVKDLINLLQKENPEALVYIACDEEGNTISPLGEGFSVGTIGNPEQFSETYTYVEGSDFQYPFDDMKKEAENKPYIIIYPSI